MLQVQGPPDFFVFEDNINYLYIVPNWVSFNTFLGIKRQTLEEYPYVDDIPSLSEAEEKLTFFINEFFNL